MNTAEECDKHRYELYLALIKVYDNYVTPLEREVKCWKTQRDQNDVFLEDSFLLGMTTTKIAWLADIDPDIFHIVYELPMKYWHRANVITLTHAPAYPSFTSNELLMRLSRL